MRKTLIIAATALVLTACGDKPAEDASSEATAKVEDKKSKDGLALTPAQKLAKAYVSSLDTMTEAIKTVTDEASAHAAAKIMEAESAKLSELEDKFGEEDSVTFKMAVAQDSYGIMQSQANLTAAMMKLGMQNPDLMDIVGEGMRAVD